MRMSSVRSVNHVEFSFRHAHPTGSNGGLLVGNLITRPIASSLFGAAVCQVPLLDMKRYSRLLAGGKLLHDSCINLDL